MGGPFTKNAGFGQGFTRAPGTSPLFRGYAGLGRLRHAARRTQLFCQSRVDTKINEHQGALELLKTVVLKVRVITGDAMFCQRDVCPQLRDDGGLYFFVVKDNQPMLKKSIAAEFRAAFSPDERTATSVVSGRSRDLWKAKWTDRTTPFSGQYTTGRVQ